MRTMVAVISPRPISKSRYHTGSLAPQHFAFPPVVNHPMTGTFSYHFSCLPQAQ